MADPKTKASALKDAGNAAVAARKYVRALECYSEAISLDPENHVLYSNRSGVYLDLSRNEDAEEDARRCVSLAPKWPKGFYRLGQALGAQKQWAGAVEAYAAGLEVDATNADLLKCKEAAEKALAAAESAAAKAGKVELRPTPQVCVDLAKHTLSPATTRAKAVAAGHNVAAYVRRHPNIRVEVLPGRGRALVAANDIAKGADVLVEPALGWYTPFADQLSSTIPGTIEFAPALLRAAESAGTDGRTLFEGVISQLGPYGNVNDAEGAAPEAARAEETVSRLDLYVNTAINNALAASFNDALPPDRRHLSVIAIAAAMINHDCEPNAGYNWHWDTEKETPAIRVHARRPIKAGEEICISYVDLSLDKLARQRRLRVQYGFQCSCARCTAPWDDTVSFKCPACHTGRVHVDAPACVDCAVPLADPATAAAGGAWAKQRLAFFARDRALGELVLCDRATRSYTEAAGKAALSTPAAIADRSTVVHLTDARRLGAIYSKLYEAIHLPHELGADIFREILPAFTRAGAAWLPQLPQLHVLGAHIFALAGDAKLAKDTYATAARLFGETYGASAPYTRIVRAMADKPPSTRADVEQFEKKRIDAGNWMVAYNLPKKVVQRWMMPLDADAALFSPNPAAAPPAQQRAMSELVALRAAANAKRSERVKALLASLPPAGGAAQDDAADTSSESGAAGAAAK